ncbi:MAG TPA: AbrB/MazE/SpoVT family DNA-binding domain-containing protein [Roseiarcus sp.]|jgi:AbrB family looped-hinge helix DNA binding protein
MAQAKTATTILSTKGQVILPKAVRDAKNWDVGRELIVEETDDGVLLRPSRPFAPVDSASVFGCLKAEGKRAKIEDFDAAIAEEMRQRHARGRY